MVDRQDANQKGKTASTVKEAFQRAGESIQHGEKAVEKAVHHGEEALHEKYKSMIKGFDGFMEGLRNSVGKVQDVERGGAGYAAIAQHVKQHEQGHSR